MNEQNLLEEELLKAADPKCLNPNMPIGILQWIGERIRIVSVDLGPWTCELIGTGFSTTAPERQDAVALMRRKIKHHYGKITALVAELQRMRAIWELDIRGSLINTVNMYPSNNTVIVTLAPNIGDITAMEIRLQLKQGLDMEEWCKKHLEL